MTTQQTTNQSTILQRLGRVQSQNRWMKRGGTVLIVLVGAAALMGSQAQPKDKPDENKTFT